MIVLIIFTFFFAYNMLEVVSLNFFLNGCTTHYHFRQFLKSITNKSFMRTPSPLKTGSYVDSMPIKATPNKVCSVIIFLKVE